ncbi:hypothetical protein HDU76_008887 [Blyttiomyces sp. JEL0837]|nr:hypothetical protein HDU76_008887 [Blyttiomyces sp. JEL0837]
MFRSELFCGHDNFADDPISLMQRALTNKKTANSSSGGNVGGTGVGAGNGASGGGISMGREAWLSGRPDSGRSVRPDSGRSIIGGQSGRPGSGAATGMGGLFGGGGYRTGNAGSGRRSISRAGIMATTMGGVGGGIGGIGGGLPGMVNGMSRGSTAARRSSNARRSSTSRGQTDNPDDKASLVSENRGADGANEPDAESELVQVKCVKPTRRKRISINDVRMARSPLADAILPPPQRFLFVQTRTGIGNLVGV